MNPFDEIDGCWAGQIAMSMQGVDLTLYFDMAFASRANARRSGSTSAPAGARSMSLGRVLRSARPANTHFLPISARAQGFSNRALQAFKIKVLPISIADVGC